MAAARPFDTRAGTAGARLSAEHGPRLQALGERPVPARYRRRWATARQGGADPGWLRRLLATGAAPGLGTAVRSAARRSDRPRHAHAERGAPAARLAGPGSHAHA